MEPLPTEIWQAIFDKVDAETYAALLRTCRYVHDTIIIRDPSARDIDDYDLDGDDPDDYTVSVLGERSSWEFSILRMDSVEVMMRAAAALKRDVAWVKKQLKYNKDISRHYFYLGGELFMLPFCEWEMDSISVAYGPKFYEIIAGVGVKINAIGRQRFERGVLSDYDTESHVYGKRELTKIFAAELYPCQHFCSNNTDIALVTLEPRKSLSSSTTSINGAYYDPHN